MFKTEKEISNFIKDNGIFINNNDLCIKTSDGEFERLNNICIDGEIVSAKTRLNEFIRYNSYPFINLNITIPEIDISIINKYHMRNAKIKDNENEQKKIKDGKDILNKKHFRLIHFDKVGRNDQHFWIYNLKTNALSIYDNNLLTESEKKKALEYPNKISFQRIVNDDLKNEYSEQFKIENAKFNELKINDAYG